MSFSRETSKKDQQDQQDRNDGGQDHFHSSRGLEPLQPYLLPGICQLFYIFSFNMVYWHLFVISFIFITILIIDHTCPLISGQRRQM